MIPVILSGGSGSRLWPLSRQLRPKQFLPIVDELTLFQSTLKRLEGLDNLQEPIVVCNEEHRFMAAEQLRTLDVNNAKILLEPQGRNTAPAIALAALLALKTDPDALLFIMPADHIISDIPTYHQAIHAAVEVANKGYLVTFGIKPTQPETGYGYIHTGALLQDTPKTGALSVNQFVEKPDLPTATTYIESGDYLWNSGLFMFQASAYLEALETFHPEILKACTKAMSGIKEDGDFSRIDTDAFLSNPKISIDYAVMEKATNSAVISLDCAWNDVGAWSAVWEVGDKDPQGNVFRGNVMARQGNSNLVYGEDKLICLVGVDNLVVVDTKDATLVAHKDSAKDVKHVVASLLEQGCDEAIIHRKVNRPWGSYDSVDSGDRFQVKRIIVKPGAKLSLQKHHHRAEHWVVVKGTAKVTCDDKIFLLAENESTYIPLGSTHRLENPEKFPLEIIEIQSGSYLGEDDIVRFSDDYGRKDE